MNKLNKEIGQILRTHREIKQITQLQLATKLGYDSTQFISLFERGISKCPTKVIGKLCKILDIDQKHFYDVIMKEFSRSLKLDLNIK